MPEEHSSSTDLTSLSAANLLPLFISQSRYFCPSEARKAAYFTDSSPQDFVDVHYHLTINACPYCVPDAQNAETPRELLMDRRADRKVLTRKETRKKSRSTELINKPSAAERPKQKHRRTKRIASNFTATRSNLDQAISAENYALLSYLRNFASRKLYKHGIYGADAEALVNESYEDACDRLGRGPFIVKYDWKDYLQNYIINHIKTIRCVLKDNSSKIAETNPESQEMIENPGDVSQEPPKRNRRRKADPEVSVASSQGIESMAAKRPSPDLTAQFAERRGRQLKAVADTLRDLQGKWLTPGLDDGLLRKLCFEVTWRESTTDHAITCADIQRRISHLFKPGTKDAGVYRRVRNAYNQALDDFAQQLLENSGLRRSEVDSFTTPSQG
jgi:hypothetical protein